MRPIAHLAIFILLGVGCSTTETKQIDPDQERKQQASEKLNSSLSLGSKYAVDGLYREAITELRKALKTDGASVEAHRLLGIVYVKVGRYERAIKHFETVIDNLANNFEANYYLAEAYRTQERFGDAIFRYKIALTAQPKNVLATKALAWSYYKIRYYRAALSTIKKLKNQENQDVQVTIIYARVLNKIARAHLNTLSAEQKPYLLSVVGDIFLSQKNFKKAEEAYREALKDQPLLAGALLGLAKVLLEKGDRADIAISYLERAARIKPGMIESFYYLGKAHYKSRPNLAKKFYTKFLRQAAGDPEYSSLVENARKKVSTFATSGQKRTSKKPSL